jgi:hypothetical protein
MCARRFLHAMHHRASQVNFLRGYHTAGRLLARPGAAPALLQHIADGAASQQLADALSCVLTQRAADFSQALSLQDARDMLQLLQGESGPQVCVFACRACACKGVRMCAARGRKSAHARMHHVVPLLRGSLSGCCVLPLRSACPQAQALALQLMTAWSAASADHQARLCSLGLAQVRACVCVCVWWGGACWRGLPAVVCAVPATACPCALCPTVTA